MVEEAAAEAGLLCTDSQRLVNVRMQTYSSHAYVLGWEH